MHVVEREKGKNIRSLADREPRLDHGLCRLIDPDNRGGGCDRKKREGPKGTDGVMVRGWRSIFQLNTGSEPALAIGLAPFAEI